MWIWVIKKARKLLRAEISQGLFSSCSERLNSSQSLLNKSCSRSVADLCNSIIQLTIKNSDL